MSNWMSFSSLNKKEEEEAAKKENEYYVGGGPTGTHFFLVC